ncbi:MAG: GNAT family N-acetyltransferase [Bacteroidetes bacterium]|nr:GNAT family N-acetyltransferase [Bacteroidota bacterium]MBU2466583.1 GNAT family N-acetyltransferase [Bacteroidota bacterium]MBU2557161.1 GNAT family N-acetyltransferase [Bacteroidota bacterium]
MIVEVRKAQRSDNEKIAHFQEEMAFETEGINLNANIIRAGIDAVFDDAAKGMYFVAEIDGIVAGSLLITYEWSDWRNSWVYWIQSVYIDKAFRRKGIYKEMYEHIQRLAEADAEVAGIRLYVDKTNVKAQKTYASLGMNGEHYQVFEWMKNS